MSTAESRTTASETARTVRERGSGIRLARVFGIEIRLDLSVLIIFVLIVHGLATGVFARWHPEWPAALAWWTALAAALLFFLSLLAHELAHSVVAQAKGIPVSRITLFLFGGVSEMSREPRTPGSEFQIAIVGPAVSAVLGIAFSAAGLALAGRGFAPRLSDDPETAFAGLSPAATLLFWLGPINLMLAIFNLVPGFPLDGGRVFRALLWSMTGDIRRATRWAANVGRAFAWILMALGVLQVLGGVLIGGFWLILIGWFLNNAARSSYLQLMVREALEGLVVRDLMRTKFEVVRPDMLLTEFIDEHLLRGSQPAWPVIDRAELVGLVTFDDVRARPPSEREGLRVRDVMQPIGEAVRPDVGGRDALRALTSAGRDPLPVLDNGTVIGLVHRADIARWLALHELEASSVSP